MSQLISKDHKAMRMVFRVVGPLVLIVGIICTVVGFMDVFKPRELPSFSEMRARLDGQPVERDEPTLFWLIFVGFPLIFVGGVISALGYAGKMARYAAGEVAPVGKDALNYMAHGIKGAVGELAGAIGAGLRGEAASDSPSVVHCPECDVDNDADAKFCKACGAKINAAITCPACSEANDPDAKFCDNCGQSLTA
jgi:uncharacterized membrane protein